MPVAKAIAWRCMVFKNFVQENRTALPGRGGTERAGSYLSGLLAAVVTVVLPVMTAAKHDGTKMGICGPQDNVPLTKKTCINSGFKIPLFNG